MSQNLQGANGLSIAFNSGALARATTASLVKSTVAIAYCLAGKFVTSKAITDNIPFTIEPNSGIVPTAPNSFKTLQAGESCAFGVLLDSAGTVTFIQGDVVPNGQLCPVPNAPAGLTSTAGAGAKVLVGALKVANTTNPFIPGTTLLSATGVTDTYFNFASHPGTPI